MRPVRFIGLALAVLASIGQATPATPLVAARELYNLGRFDEAIAAARRALDAEDDRNAAAVVLARAHLERYRQRLEPADLRSAEAALERVEATALNASDHVEWLVALGVALYLDDEGGLEDRYSAAAELFEMVLERADGAVGATSRERILEWWASALDRQAQFGQASKREAIYARVLARADHELSRNDRSTVAFYWRVAALAGIGDFERAWGAAVAAWLQAGHLNADGAALRFDLDRFVMTVLLPERAMQLTPDADPRPTLERLAAGWESFKAKWKTP
ncbi:MAG TPA: hypothetical protein VLA20_05665 [Vicinamibacterales bacterium]|nr:hypothetical protein [Vicinamibacterales bacterium]